MVFTKSVFFLSLNCFWRNSSQGPRASSFASFQDPRQRRTRVGRTPVDEWSARRRDLYLTTHNTHNRQTSMPPVGFEHTISADQRSQTHALDRAVTGTGVSPYLCSSNKLRSYANAVTNLNTRRMLCNGKINFMCSQQRVTSPPIRSFTSDYPLLRIFSKRFRQSICMFPVSRTDYLFRKSCYKAFITSTKCLLFLWQITQSVITKHWCHLYSPCRLKYCAMNDYTVNLHFHSNFCFEDCNIMQTAITFTWRR